MKLAKKRRKLRVIRPDTVIESEKSREDKSRNLKIKVITIIGIVCALLLAIYLFCVYRTYNNYKVRKTIKIETGTNSQYQAFGEFVVKYSNFVHQWNRNHLERSVRNEITNSRRLWRLFSDSG